MKRSDCTVDCSIRSIHPHRENEAKDRPNMGNCPTVESLGTTATRLQHWAGGNGKQWAVDT